MKAYVLLAALFAVSAHADSFSMTGTLNEYIEPTHPLSAIDMSLSTDTDDQAIGFSASPKPQGNEIADALAQFTDETAAMHVIEDYKKKQGFTGGRLFAGFTYGDDNGKTTFGCGISRAETGDYDNSRAQGVWYGDIGSGGSFENFKRSSHDERVRAIAKCFATLPGMPPLNPLPHEIKHIVIDKNSYDWAEKYFHAKGLIGTKGQYDDALSCLVLEEASRMPDATGDTAVMKLTTHEKVTKEVVTRDPNWYDLPDSRREETDNVQMLSAGVAATSQANANRILKSSTIDSMWGLWPVTMGFSSSSDPFNELFKDALSDVPACLRQAGLFSSGFAIKAAPFAQPLKPCGT